MEKHLNKTGACDLLLLDRGYPYYQDTTITCRLIKVVLAGGGKEILCTSLLDAEKYPYEEFAGLYHYRWGEEEAYKLLKCRAELEGFPGKTSIAVKQDFFAKIFLMSLCAIYAPDFDGLILQKHDYQSSVFS